MAQTGRSNVRYVDPQRRYTVVLGPSWNAPIGALPHDDRAGTHDGADGRCGSYASIGRGQAALWITSKNFYRGGGSRTSLLRRAECISPECVLRTRPIRMHLRRQCARKPRAAGREPRRRALADNVHRQQAVAGEIGDGRPVYPRVGGSRRLPSPHPAALMQRPVAMQEGDQSCPFCRGENGDGRRPFVRLRRRHAVRTTRFAAGTFFAMVWISFKHDGPRK
jgi:hypothetical protein